MPLCNQRKKCERFQFRRIPAFPTGFTWMKKERLGRKERSEGERERREEAGSVIKER